MMIGSAALLPAATPAAMLIGWRQQDALCRTNTRLSTVAPAEQARQQ